MSVCQSVSINIVCVVLHFSLPLSSTPQVWELFLNKDAVKEMLARYIHTVHIRYIVYNTMLILLHV